MKCIQLNENNVIVNVCESDTVVFGDGIVIDTDKSLEELFGKFKYEHGKLIECKQIDICTPKTNQELQEEIENLKTQLETVHERLCTQQEMSATIIASVFGNEVLKNE